MRNEMINSIKNCVLPTNMDSEMLNDYIKKLSNPLLIKELNKSNDIEFIKEYVLASLIVVVCTYTTICTSAYSGYMEGYTALVASLIIEIYELKRLIPKVFQDAEEEISNYIEKLNNMEYYLNNGEIPKRSNKYKK